MPSLRSRFEDRWLLLGYAKAKINKNYILGPEQMIDWNQHAPAICQMLRVLEVRVVSEVPPGAVSFVVGGLTFAMPLVDVIDLDAERERLAKQVVALDATIAQARAKLNDSAFTARAPAEVVSETRRRLEEAETARARMVGLCGD